MSQTHSTKHIYFSHFYDLLQKNEFKTLKSEEENTNVNLKYFK